MMKRLNPGTATARGSPASTSFTKNTADTRGHAAFDFKQAAVFFGDGTGKRTI